MKILLTGGSGYVGRRVLDELLRRGHTVIAAVRSVPPPDWAQMPNLTVIRGDLVDLSVAAIAQQNVDCTIHLAAALGGGVEQQTRDTLTATQTLLAALRDAGIRRLVGVSSMAVLDYVSQRKMALIDEHVAVADEKSGLGDYARFKLRQEQLFDDFGRQPGNSCVIVRPGLIYDQDRLISAYAGIFVGPLGVLASHAGEVPTVEVHGVARAIASAAELELKGCEVIQLVDDHLPRQPEYIEGLRRRGQLPPAQLTLPSGVVGMIARFFRLLTAVARKAPEITAPQAFAARLRPFRYSNEKAKSLLAWHPEQRFT